MSSSLSHWSPPPENLELAAGQVHLWRFRLDLPTDENSELSQLLSDDEKLRAERLLDRLKADSFIVARGRLRQILSSYLNLKPDHIEFAYGTHGKPYLKDIHDNSLAFNLAHAGQWGMLAVTSGTDVGVDIEKIDPNLDFEKIVSSFFSATEIERLKQTAPHRRRRTFYRIWTSKEARLKQLGSGFSTPATITETSEQQIISFTIDRDYLGAVAVPEDNKTNYRYDLK